jgi:hypothetical protein
MTAPPIPGVRVIAAAPVLDLVAHWRSELEIIERRSPHSDALPSLATCTAELVTALHAAQDVRVDLTLTDAHAISGIALRTLQKICQRTPHILGARRRAHRWYLDRRVFEHYIAGHPGRRPRQTERISTNGNAARDGE